MAQHDYNIADQPGASFLADLNAALAAIVSQNSGAAEPSPTFAYQLWADTTSGKLKMRNAANTAWLDVMTLADAKALGITDAALGSGTPDSTKFLRGDRSWAAVPGRLINIVRITTPGSGTYTKPTNVTRLLIRAIGGGGGGGGGGSSARGGGGGSGGYGESFITSPASSYSYTVGAGGAGGIYNSTNGSAGGATTIAGISAGGGSGGQTPVNGNYGGSGGVTGGANINVPGTRGFDSSSGGYGGGGVFNSSDFGGSQFGAGGGGGYAGGGNGIDGGAGYIEIWEFE
jgi:hypothetical protein